MIGALWYPTTVAGTCAVCATVSPWTPLTCVAAIGTVVLLADAVARVKEYRALVREQENGTATLYNQVYRYRRTRCRREVMLAVASHFGQRSQVSGVYRTLGYRWYHIMPDHSFSRNTPFLKPRFWREVFGG